MFIYNIYEGKASKTEPSIEEKLINGEAMLHFDVDYKKKPNLRRKYLKRSFPDDLHPVYDKRYDP